MSTVSTWQTESTSSNDTWRLGEAVGRRAKGSEVIELVSDLGGGKTEFVRGLAKGMGSDDQVASPTFTISREYKAGKLQLHHYDFYRLIDPGVMTEELKESIGQNDVVTVIEWSDVVRGVLPEDRLRVKIKVTGETSRNFSFMAGKKHRHLIEQD